MYIENSRGLGTDPCGTTLLVIIEMTPRLQTIESETKLHFSKHDLFTQVNLKTG